MCLLCKRCPKCAEAAVDSDGKEGMGMRREVGDLADKRYHRCSGESDWSRSSLEDWDECGMNNIRTLDCAHMECQIWPF